MKYAWLVFVSLIGVILYYLSSKKTTTPTLQGGLLIPKENPLTTPAAQSQVGASSNGALMSADQKVIGAQPDIIHVNEVLPNLVWNPTDITDMIQKNAAPPSSNTFPNPAPSSYVNDNQPVSDLSPTFWAADKVPMNPFLANGLTGPSLTD